jgi:hypothetical protein
VVFPPCDATGFASLPLSSPPRKPLVLSIGQFRPEKDHALQIRSFARMLSKPGVPKGATLVLLGGVRDEGDQGRVDELRSLCESLGVEKRVEFVLNQPYSVLKDYLGKSSVGLHCMWNEHFGIGVVEMMAAGLVVRQRKARKSERAGERASKLHCTAPPRASLRRPRELHPPPPTPPSPRSLHCAAPPRASRRRPRELHLPPPNPPLPSTAGRCPLLGRAQG